MLFTWVSRGTESGLNWLEKLLPAFTEAERLRYVPAADRSDGSGPVTLPTLDAGVEEAELVNRPG